MRLVGMSNELSTSSYCIPSKRGGWGDWLRVVSAGRLRNYLKSKSDERTETNSPKSKSKLTSSFYFRFVFDEFKCEYLMIRLLTLTYSYYHEVYINGWKWAYGQLIIVATVWQTFSYFRLNKCASWILKSSLTAVAFTITCFKTSPFIDGNKP